MEQLSLFGEDSLEEKTESVKIEENDASEDAQEEKEINEYTPEQLRIIEYAKGIVDESFDPWCRLHLYISSRNFYKVDYYDGSDKTVYLEVTDLLAAQKATERRKLFHGATIKSIEEVDENTIPKGSKVFEAASDKISIYPDFVLSKPRWFTIDIKKKYYGIQVVFNPNLVINSKLKECLNGYDYQISDGWMTVNTKSLDFEELFSTLLDLRPIIKDRFMFLFDHRIIEQCCCNLQNSCTKEGRCLSEYREMQMKCSYRRLMERNGKFDKKPLYKGE